jgi:hypothetical protein
MPEVPDYAGIAEALQRSPELASSGALSAPAVAGGQAYMQATPQVEALRAAKPGIGDLLRALF